MNRRIHIIFCLAVEILGSDDGSPLLLSILRSEGAPEIRTKIWDLLSGGDGTPEIPPRVGLRRQT